MKTVAAKRTDELFRGLDMLIVATEGFVSRWGDVSEQLVDDLTTYFGHPLPPSFRAFALRYGNAHIGYVPINVLGPLHGVPAAQSLTQDRRLEWSPLFPDDRLALGEEGTDMIVLCPNGAVEVRTESSRDLMVFQTYDSFEEFLEYCIDRATSDAKWLDLIPEDFSPWT